MSKNVETQQSSQVLREAFERFSQHDGLTIRKWAEMVDMSPAYISLVLNSKRLPNMETLKKLAQSLDFDALALDRLQRAHHEDWLKSKGIDAQKVTKQSETADHLAEVEEVIDDHSALLSHWLHLALLEFTQCVNYEEDARFLASRFGVSEREIRASLQLVPDLKLAEYAETGKAGGVRRLRKTKAKIRIPTARSRKVIRDFHSQHLRKALDELKKSDANSYEKRLMSGYTISVNPEHVQEAKLMIEKALVEIATKLCAGPATEVYQLQIQLFPLTK